MRDYTIEELRERYKRGPMLRFIDAFILWTIDALDDETARTYDEWTPKIRATFGMESGTWQEVVAARMEFDDEYVEWFRRKWAEQLEHDREIGQEHNPLAWTHWMADNVTREEKSATS